MADSKLKLQIVTALDNAGIKATKEQIAGLEQELAKVGNNKSLSDAEKKLSKLGGPLGKLQDIFGGLNGTLAKVGGTATAVAAAFKAGWDIGDWIQTKVINPLFKIKDPIDELKKKNKELQNEHQKTIDKFQHQQQVTDNTFANASSGIDAQISHIDKLNAAWQKAARAKVAYQTADKDIEMQLLERERFEDIMTLTNEGDIAGAEQANKLYDVYAAMLQAKKEMAQYDAETAAIEKKLEDTENKRWMILDKIAAAEKDVRAKEAEKEKVEEIATSEAEYRRLKLRADQRHYSAVRRLRNAENELAEFDASDQGQLELATRAKQRLVLADKLNLGIDKAAFNYDQTLAENGNMLGINFTDEFKQALFDSSEKSAMALVDAVSKGVKEGIGELLEVK